MTSEQHELIRKLRATAKEMRDHQWALFCPELLERAAAELQEALNALGTGKPQ